jgi:hypothetical protein
MGTDAILLEETEKWAKKIASELENAEAGSPKGKEMLSNIRAYVSDSAHFAEKEDLVRAFEAIIWAWAWLEIGISLQYITKEYVDIRKLRTQEQ